MHLPDRFNDGNISIEFGYLGDGYLEDFFEDVFALSPGITFEEIDYDSFVDDDQTNDESYPKETMKALFKRSKSLVD